LSFSVGDSRPWVTGSRSMNSSLAPVQYMVFLALFRMSYEITSIRKQSPAQISYLIQRDTPDEPINARQKEWADKAIQKYAAAQDKKWQRWNEAMFEKVN